MTVLLLDERWPTLVPMEAHGVLRGPVTFTDEVPVKVRWNFGDLLAGDDPLGIGVLVSTNNVDPQVRVRIAAGEEVIEAPSRKDPIRRARHLMARACTVGQWEASQSHLSLLPYLTEEAKEFAEAVEAGADDAVLVKELGDIFLQVLFHAEIASRRGAFGLDDVAASFIAKMRSRAPYLFTASTETVSVEEQERMWAEGKAREAGAS